MDNLTNSDAASRRLSEHETPAVFNAEGLSRVFEVGSGGHLELRHATIFGGKAMAGPLADPPDGGAILVDGGKLTMKSVVVRDSVATGRGGAIAVLQGESTLDNVTITSNEAADGGGVFVSGSSHHMTRVKVDSNMARGAGGGLMVSSAGLIVMTMVAFNLNYASRGSALSLCKDCRWQGLVVDVKGAPPPPPSRAPASPCT